MRTAVEQALHKDTEALEVTTENVAKQSNATSLANQTLYHVATLVIGSGQCQLFVAQNVFSRSVRSHDLSVHRTLLFWWLCNVCFVSLSSTC